MKYLSILLLLLFIQCATAKTITYDPSAPDSSYGCSNVPGRLFFECAKKQSLRFDKIESSIPIDTVLQETRNGNYLTKRIQTCRHDLCHVRQETIYDPTFLYLITEKGVIGGIGILLGVILFP
ncbi:hypothetical protein [Leptospira phage LE3]|uniref:Uncharacterized protein n=2 Tax=Nylescharonvirus TaxID=2843431 RepID=A0A343LEF2_9CAUD|nr:hypothetical protein HWB33_gp51 [Leptospira phage LE3]YP_009835524.1 hypothetical protein HWB34_gp49 [Leptospira phage LE4]ATN94943.1 hypothetical protein [Leptospira phage LE3]ATN95062.1 hypothetical protein [Leptospira phage LE4]